MILIQNPDKDSRRDAISKIELVHDEDVFDKARKIFYENVELRDKMLSVTGEPGIRYYLRWEANRVDEVHYVEEFWEYNINDSRIDYELLDRGEVYLFFTFEEYTYQIARIVQREYPHKYIFFLDQNAGLFFSETPYLHIISSIADLYNKYRMCISKVILTIDSQKEFLNNYMRAIIKRYRSLSVMTSLFWKRNVTAYGKKNPDKLFYVIKDRLGGSGLGDMIKRALLKAAMVKEKPGNIIPIIDFSAEGDWNQFTEGSGENAWTLYFEQISDISLKEVYESENVIVSSHDGWDVFNPYYHEKNCFMDWKSMFQKYLHINNKAMRYIDALYTKTVPPEKSRVLGVIGRGTDYHSEKSVGTPKPKETQAFIQEVERYAKQWRCEYIFLATEDKAVYESFMKSSIKEKIIAVDQERIDYCDERNKNLFLYEIKKRDHKGGYFDSLQYLGILYILSKCDCLMSTCFCGAVQCAVGMNNGKYEDVKIF